ncbi:MAG: PilZ domain-containing protein [Candidatus Omnitrophota bacterium]
MMEDKREYKRYGVYLAPICCESCEYDNMRVRINDISGSGIGIITNEKMNKADKLHLELNIPGDDIPLFVTGQVTWVSEDMNNDNYYRAGMRLTNLNRTDKARLIKYISSSCSY